jgi:hypothetical protein
MPEKQKNLPEKVQSDNPAPIEKLKLEKVNGFRRRMKELFRKIILIGGIGLASGGVAGKMGQDKFRGWMDYDPARVEEVKAETPKAPVEKEPQGYYEKAKRTLAAAKRIVGEKISDVTEHSETVQQYRQMRKELAEIKKKFLEAGDKTAFWLPFLLTFLATVMVANKILQVKKSLSESVDPAVERNMARIESKLNELVDRVNGMQEEPVLSPAEQAKLLRELDELSSDEPPDDFLAEDYELDKEGTKSAA